MHSPPGGGTTGEYNVTVSGSLIGNQYETIGSDNGEYFVQLNGEYPNASNYVRVKQVKFTKSYFRANPIPYEKEEFGYYELKDCVIKITN